MVVNVGSFQKGIEVVMLSSLMMVTVARCTSRITAGALRILDNEGQISYTGAWSGTDTLTNCNKVELDKI